MNTIFRRCAALLWATTLLSGPAYAAPIYGTPVGPADYSGQRAYYKSGANAAKIQWQITDNGNGTFTYRYTAIIPDIPGKDPFKSVSHFTLDLSDDFDEDDQTALVESAASNSEDFETCLIEFGDKDTLTGAVKFDFGGGKPEDCGFEDTDGNPLYYEFTIDRTPVWGNFAVKDGNGLWRNKALKLGTVLTSENAHDFIVVPNGHHAPEPSALWLAAAGLVCLAYWCGWSCLGAKT
jgi:hypothetical protein